MTALDDAYARIDALDDPAIVVSRLARAAVPDPRPGPLHGVPVLVKDNIAVRGLPTGAGCPAYGDGPALRSAAIVTALEDAGASVFGTTNMDQFATGLVGTRSPYGVPRNPLAPDRIPGGSSSGAGVAVARGIVPLAIGTDTAGSGRVPAACTGTVGLKPTRGLVSTGGIVPAVPGLDCVSFHARSVAGVWRGLEAVAGPFEWATATPRLARVAPSVIAATCEPAVADAYERTCRSLDLHEIVDLGPFFAAGRMLYGPWVAARTAAFGEFLDAHPEDVHPVVAEIVGRGRVVTGVEVFAAQAELFALVERVNQVWDDVDALVVPTIPFLPTLAEVAADPIGVNARLGRFTDFVNLLDCCAIAVPGAARADELPFGVSVIAPAGADALVAQVGAAITSEGFSPNAQPSARVAVVGAHLRGLPLHHQLTDLDAELVATTHTAPSYRLYALAGTTPPKPGLVRADPGAAIACEVYALSDAALGRFVAQVAAPLAIGPVELANGTTVPGFLAAEGALAGATDVTAGGGWRAYLATQEEAS